MVIIFYLFIRKIIKESNDTTSILNYNNQKKLLELKNKHKNQRAIIIGMGPSLKVSDLDRLKNEITFGCNKVYLAFEDTKWRPTYYSVSDTLVAKNNYKTINDLNLFKIHRSNTFSYLNGDNVLWVKDLKFVHKSLQKTGLYFWDRIDKGCFRGGTVLYMQLQIAAWMGIKEIYLIGVDYDFSISKNSGLKSDVGDVLINSNEKNHFHPDYRKKGESWAKPNLEMQLKAFNKAKEYARLNDIKIYNASRATKLDVFERINFDEVFKI